MIHGASLPTALACLAGLITTLLIAAAVLFKPRAKVVEEGGEDRPDGEPVHVAFRRGRGK